MPSCCKLFLILAAFMIYNYSDAQPATPAAKLKTAPVEVTVTDAHKQPRTKEQVLFKAKRGGKLFGGRTDKEDRLLIALPAGDEYAVMLNTINDITYFGSLPIPPLSSSETCTKPFVLSMT